MIAKKIGANVLPRNLGLSSGEVHCSPVKLAFPRKIIMSPGK